LYYREDHIRLDCCSTPHDLTFKVFSEENDCCWLRTHNTDGSQRLFVWIFDAFMYNVLALSFLVKIMGFIAAANYFLSARPPYLFR